MKVLFWSEAFYPHIGGVEVLGTQLVRALKARGIELLLVCGPYLPGRPDPETFEGIPLYRFPFAFTKQPNNLALITQIKQKLAELVRAFQPDVLHIFQVHTSFLMRLEPIRRGITPTLLTLHGLDREGPEMWRGRCRLMRQADWVNTCSEAMLVEARAAARDECGLELANASAIRNAIVPPTLAPTPLPFDPPLVLGIGRFHKQKGFEYALDAFARVLTRVPQARLMLAGDGHDRAALQARAAQLGIHAQTDFPGWVVPKQVPALLNRATMLLVPSRWEPFGLVALEASYMARPVIGSRVDGLPEIVRDGETGLLVEPGNVPALAEALESLLTNPARAAALGTAARAYVTREFQWDDFVSQYVRLYEQLIERAGGGTA